MSTDQRLCVQVPLCRGRILQSALTQAKLLCHRLANGFEYVVPGQCVFMCPFPCDSLLPPVIAPSHLTPELVSLSMVAVYLARLPLTCPITIYLLPC